MMKRKRRDPVYQRKVKDRERLEKDAWGENQGEVR